MIKSYLHSTVVRVKVGVTGFANFFPSKVSFLKSVILEI